MHKKQSKLTVAIFKRRISALFLLLPLLGLIVGNAYVAHADTYDVKIRALEAQNDKNRAALDNLQAQALSYQETINQLEQQIASLQRSIAANEAQQVQLTKQIAAKQIEIDNQREVLGDVLRSMYVDGEMSTIEMLATSNSLSDYVDKQEYRNSVQGKIQESLQQITALQQQLRTKKTQLAQVAAGLRDQKTQLSTSRQEQASLLAYNQSQKNAYNAKVKSNEAKISKLEAEQAAAQAAYAAAHGINYYGTSGNGGYPNKWANVPLNSRVDDWGMYNRQCVSYVAWKVSSTGHYMPHWGGNYSKYYGGNAYRWIDNANIDRIPHTGSPPSPGDYSRAGVAVMWDQYDGVGSFGHVAYLEAVNSDGSIEVSQYNFFSKSLGHGKFSRMHLSAGDANQLDYIYFR